MRQHLTPFSRFLHREHHLTKRPYVSTSTSTSTDTLPRDWRREHCRHWGQSWPSPLCFPLCLRINPPSGAFSWTVPVVWFFTPWQLGGECRHDSEESPTDGVTCLFFHPRFFFPSFCIGARSPPPPTWKNSWNTSRRLASASSRLWNISPPGKDRPSTSLQLSEPPPHTCRPRTPTHRPRGYFQKWLPTMTSRLFYRCLKIQRPWKAGYPLTGHGPWLPS